MRRFIAVLMVLGGSTAGHARAPRPKGITLSRAQIHATVAAFKAARRMGRKLSRKHDYVGAEAAFRRALSLDPSNGPLLGELGWVLFKSGDTARSTRLTRQAITLTRDHKQLGALYYNLGRAAEATNHRDDARLFYARSLAYRPGNKTVQSRLTTLSHAGGALAKKPLANLCAEAMANWGCVEHGDGLQCSCAVERIIEAPLTHGPAPVRAALLRVQGEGMGVLDERALAIETGTGGWQLVGSVATNWTPGVSYINHTGKIDAFRFEAVAGHGTEGSALVLEATQYESDGDYGANLVEYSDRHILTICAASRSHGHCVTMDVASESGVDRMLEDEPVARRDRRRIGSTEWAVEHTVLDGHLILKGGGALPAEVRKRLGVHDLTTLDRLPGVETTPLH